MTKKADKIKEIHSVVTRLFAQKGYHNTSMREIARGLNMNQSSLYHYFNSKDDRQSSRQVKQFLEMFST